MKNRYYLYFSIELSYLMLDAVTGRANVSTFIHFVYHVANVNTCLVSWDRSFNKKAIYLSEFEMATRYFIRNVVSCLFRETLSSKKTIKPFQNFVLINRHLTACSVGINENSKCLVIQWQNNLTDEYPLVWLRDNCQCSSCFDQASQSRTINFSHFEVNQKCSSPVSFLTISDDFYTFCNA